MKMQRLLDNRELVIVIQLSGLPETRTRKLLKPEPEPEPEKPEKYRVFKPEPECSREFPFRKLGKFPGNSFAIFSFLEN